MAKLFQDDQIERDDIDTLKHLLRAKLGGYAVAIKSVDLSNAFYRGVRWAERPRFTHQVSYPPAAVAGLGRANRSGRVMFYASCGAAPVFYELRAKPGDRIALSKWSVMESFWAHNLGFHEAALHKLGGTSVPLRHALTNPIPNESKFNRKLRRMLSLAFTEDIRSSNEYRYKQTVAITELLFDKAELLPKTAAGPKIDRVGGIVYPAVQMRGVADNIAIWPEFVDGCLRLEEVRYLFVEKADEASTSYTLRLLAIAQEFPGGEIVWRDWAALEDESRNSISFESGQWVQRSSNGAIVDVH
jgi:hypothetical protein